MWKVITFAIFTIFAAQVSASGNDAIKRTIEDQIAAFKLNEFETAFTGWFWTGIRRDIWLEYPYQTISINPITDKRASTDLHWSKRILSDGKYKQMCFKEARVLHLSYMNKDYEDLNFDNKQIIKEYIKNV